MAKLYHGAGQLPGGGFPIRFLLLRNFSSPLLKSDLVIYLLPPVGSFSYMIRECTHPQLDDLVELCRKLATTLEEPAPTVLGCSFP